MRHQLRTTLLVAGAALLLASCSTGPWIGDPGCRAAYDHCAAACPLGAPEPPPGAGPGLSSPSLERGCLNDCYRRARTCQAQADERREPPEAPSPVF